MSEPHPPSNGSSEVNPPGEADSITLTIVVPCKNEEANITGTLQTIAGAMKEIGCSYEVLVMDDGSTDGTSSRIAEFQRIHPELPIRHHRNPTNIGVSRTYVNGAFLGKGKYYRMVCGDNVEPQETMVAIFKMMGQADIIIPYHQKLTGKSGLRIAISKFYTFLVNLFSGNSIHYYNGCALHLRKHVLRWHSYAFGFGFQADFTTRLIQEGASHQEIAIRATHVNKGKGSSPFN
ncbi:MAG: glycosyltransferase, partial [Verrucomicrobia bacterium]|nr:glycosyltransferase [Verrucomicrobiota bacterium]